MTKRSVCSFTCVCVFFLISGSLSQDSCRQSEIPNSNLREIVIGKCTIYQELINHQMFCDGNTFKSRNCTEIWDSFSEAFLYQPRCNVSEERYAEYIRLTNHPVPADKSLFWENVFPFVHRFSHKGAKYYTLSDTLTGYIGNMLLWCSDPDDGMVAPPAHCPGFESTPSCPQGALRAFWIAASRSFGVRASGEIHIMMDADNQPIFDNTTYLAEYELPYLTSKVKKATVLLLNKTPAKDRTKCDDPSLDVLAELMKSKGIMFECVENRRDMVDLYCLDNPQSKVCSTLAVQTNSAIYMSASSILVGTMLMYAKSIVN